MNDLMQTIYPQIQIELRCQKPLETLQLDRDDMLELIGNLLDKACKFAATKALLEIATSKQLP